MQKVTLITGGTSGIGKAMSEALASEEYLVYATGRNIPTASDIKNLHYRYLDVRNNDSVIGAVKGITDQHGQIDILINNAGLGFAGPLEETPFEDIYNLFETNYFGTIRTTRHVIPFMRQKGSGLIVNISSIAGRVGLPFQSIYSSSKFAIESLTESLRIELKPFGINVCMIEPGDYNTNVNKNRGRAFSSNDSPYFKRLKGLFDLLEKNINGGSNPEKMGRLVIKIASARSPKLRYTSGRFFERITPAAKSILPDRLFEWILTRFYRL
ncbi:MAG: SDR family oxidoreductase [Bacteroidales bacterium]|nr:SDR family oxidoreductase [Bacteroidales bacterium]